MWNYTTTEHTPYYQCGETDYVDASQLLLISALSSDAGQRPKWTVHKNEFYLVEMRVSNENWPRVPEEMLKTYKGEVGVRMSYGQAFALYRYLCKK